MARIGQRMVDFDAVGAPRHRGGSPQKYILTPEGRQLILDHYDSQPETITWMEEKLSVPRHILKKWARELGKSKQMNRWTEEETQYLLDNIHKKSLKQLGQALNKTPISVRVKCQSMKLSRVKHVDGYNITEVGLGIGRDRTAVLRLAEKGWLKGKRQGKNAREWNFNDKNIRTFILSYPHEVNQCKMDWLWVVDVISADGLGELIGVRGKADKE
jgi:hypothetical protein